MPDILLHPQTAAALAQVTKRPPHAVLLSGNPGIGKAAVAAKLAADLLDLAPSKLAVYPYLRRVRPSEGNTISIDAIRELEHFLTLKIPSRQAVSRIAIIEDAHSLTTEAQNALLKTLEEPPEHSLLLLTSAHDQALLPTIRSRVQTITVKRPPTGQLEAYLGAAGYSSADVQRAMALGGGLPGLVTALLNDDQNHPLASATLIARDILQKSTYQRLLLVDELSKQRDACLDTLFILEQMSHVALSRPGANVGRWQSVLGASYAAREQLLRRSQPKLVMTNLMLQL